MRNIDIALDELQTAADAACERIAALEQENAALREALGLAIEKPPIQYPAMLLRNMIKQHDNSMGWARDCSCTWHQLARVYFARLEAHRD